MVIRTDIENVLRAWFVSVTGLSRVIFADQGGARPDKPYGTLKVMTGLVRLSSHDDRRMPKEDDDSRQMQVTGLRNVSLSCQVFGDGAVDYLNQAQASFGKPSVFESLFWRSHEAVLSVDDVQDSTVYMITVNGAAISITSGIGATAGSIRTALLAEFANVTIPHAVVEMEEDGTTLVVTSKKEIDVAVTANLSIDSETTGVRLAYIEDTGVNDLTALLEVGYEARAQMDATFHVTSMVTDDPSTIDTVNVQQTILDPSGSTVEQDTFEVTV